MKLTDLLCIIFLLTTVVLGGYAYCEWKKTTTGSNDIRKPSLEKALTGKEEKRNLSFEQAVKHTE